MTQFLRLANITVPAGNQLTNPTTRTLFADTYLVPSNSYVASNTGILYRFEAFGYISSLVSGTPGTLKLDIEIGGTVLGTATINLPTAGLTNAGFYFKGFAMVCATATTGPTMSCQGFGWVDNGGVAITAAMVNTGLTTTGQINVNTQTGGALGMGAIYSVSSASNIVTLTQLIIEEEQ